MTPKKKKLPAKAKRKPARRQSAAQMQLDTISRKLIRIDGLIGCVGTAVEALASGQAMLSERLESLYDDSHANDCLTHRRIEAFTDLLQILTDSHTSNYATLVQHCERLLREKETLQKMVAAMEAPAVAQREYNDAASRFMSEPAKTRSTFAQFGVTTHPINRDVQYVGAIGIHCDHEILSPHCTVTFRDGKRWCHACTSWLEPQYKAEPLRTDHADGSVTLAYGSAACTVAHLHVHGIRCGVCGVQG